jgi:hypothetical protein
MAVTTPKRIAVTAAMAIVAASTSRSMLTVATRGMVEGLAATSARKPNPRIESGSP